MYPSINYMPKKIHNLNLVIMPDNTCFKFMITDGVEGVETNSKKYEFDKFVHIDFTIILTTVMKLKLYRKDLIIYAHKTTMIQKPCSDTTCYQLWNSTIPKRSLSNHCIIIFKHINMKEEAYLDPLEFFLTSES